MPIVPAILVFIILAYLFISGWEYFLLLALVVAIIFPLVFYVGFIIKEEVELIDEIDLLKYNMLDILKREIKGDITHDYKCERPWIKVSYDGSVYTFYLYWTQEYGYGFYRKGSRVPFYEEFCKMHNNRYVALFRRDMYLDEHFFDEQQPTYLNYRYNH